MKHTLPWNVNGIPSEARDAARAAAMREGMSVGDWLTRRILAETGKPEEAQEQPPAPGLRFVRESEPRRDREPETRREQDDLAVRLTRSEAETDTAIRRIDEAVRAMARRLDSTERSQSDAHRAMSSAASEISAATRDQAQAFVRLTERIDQIEHQSDNGGLREAVRALHQGLSRLADQLAQTASETTGEVEKLAAQVTRAANDSTTQVTALGNRVETLSGSVASAREYSSELGQFVEERFAALAERVKHAEDRLSAARRLEDVVFQFEARLTATDDRLKDAFADQATSIHALENRIQSSDRKIQDALTAHTAAGNRLAQDLSTLEKRVQASEIQVQEKFAHRSASDAKIEENLTALETHLKSSDQRMLDALANNPAAKLEQDLAALVSRLNSSEERMQDALASQETANSKLEERLSALDSRMESSEEHVQDALAHQAASGSRLEQSLSALDARIKSSEERTQEALSRHMSSGTRLEDAIAALQAAMKSSEERVQESVGRHLASIERNLESIVTRLEHAEQNVEDEAGLKEGFRIFSERMDKAEKKNRETLAELQANLGDTAKRIEAVEVAQRSKPKAEPQDEPIPKLRPDGYPGADTMHMGPLPGGPSGPSFDLPPFVDAPPFPSGSFEPPRPGEDHNPLLAPDAADIFAPSNEQMPVEVQDYLTQARRAARAAAEDMSARNPMAPQGGGAQGEFANRKKLPRLLRPVAAAVIGIVLLLAGMLLFRGWGPHTQTVALAPDATIALNGGGTAAPDVPAPGQGQAGAGYDLSALALQAGTGAQGAPNLIPPPPADAQPSQGTATAANIGPEARVARPEPPKAAPTEPVSAPKPLTPPPPPTPLDQLTSKAESGDAKAALVLGLKYADGDGVPANDPDAVRWLRRAAEAGEAVAQYRLGTLYEKGRGVPADSKVAAMWYGESAKLGNRKAMHNLAVAYADGAGLEKNFAEAARWFRNAADLGLTDSQFNLAVLYERGLGVPASLADAYKWYAIAAASGDAESKVRVEALTTQLQPAEKENADKAVKAFKAHSLVASSNEPPSLAQVIP